MRRKLVCLLGLASSLAFCGCKHYEIRLVEPANFAQTIGKKTAVTVPDPPLEYRLSRSGDSVNMRVVNPTDDPIALLGTKSYVVDSSGETHPVRERIIGPHSYVGMSLPPPPRIYSSGYYGGYGIGYGYYDPYFWHPFFGPPSFYAYGPYYYSPQFFSYRVITPYDWEWGKGPVRLQLEYERARTNFVHNFIFERRELK